MRGKEGWTPGIITKELTPGRMYKIKGNDGRIGKHYVDQLTERSPNSGKSVIESEASTGEAVPKVRRSERLQKII